MRISSDRTYLLSKRVYLSILKYMAFYKDLLKTMFKNTKHAQYIFLNNKSHPTLYDRKTTKTQHFYTNFIEYSNNFLEF
tara:strand:+ start:1439 stop:1675 length:237 start_codon:yes stop_codon:yes gene_type:complete